jgi:hypothetical protein
MMFPRTWRKSQTLRIETPRAIAEMLAEHPEIRSRPSLNAKSERLSRLLGCSVNTARAMLSGIPAGREYYTVVIENCGGWDRYLRLCGEAAS